MRNTTNGIDTSKGVHAVLVNLFCIVTKRFTAVSSTLHLSIISGTSHVAIGGSRGLVVKVLDFKFEGCEFKTHTGHSSFSKLRQFRLPYFASVYSAANEYKHCLEGTCDGLVSRPGESV